MAWNDNMTSVFLCGWIACFYESISVWLNRFSCPGWMVVPRKPHPFGNEYHTICCCLCGILFSLEIVEGKDRAGVLGSLRFEGKGKTVDLLLRVCEPIWHTGTVIVLDSGFCVVKGIL